MSTSLLRAHLIWKKRYKTLKHYQIQRIYFKETNHIKISKYKYILCSSRMYKTEKPIGLPQLEK